MIPDAFTLRGKYADSKMPVIIIAGDQDRIVNTEAQSAASLHEELTHSTFRRVTNAGHMVHQTATALVMRAIDEVALQERGDHPGVRHAAA